MGRNNDDFDNGRRYPRNPLTSKQIEEHNRNKGAWRTAVQDEQGRAAESYDRRKAAALEAGEL